MEKVEEDDAVALGCRALEVTEAEEPLTGLLSDEIEVYACEDPIDSGEAGRGEELLRVKNGGAGGGS